MIFENFISQDLANTIVDNTKQSNDLKQAQIKIQNPNGIIESDIDEQFRKTNIYTLDADTHQVYMSRLEVIKNEIENFYNIILTHSTDAQVLEYLQGSFYTKHADDSSELLDHAGHTVGFVNVAPQRKITSVLFCTSSSTDSGIDLDYNFYGGGLKFNYLYDKDAKQIEFYPKSGDLIVFPSNPYFSHEVLPVVGGYRLTVVQWHDALLL